MFLIKSSGKSALPKIADCQMACFPASFATKLGAKYVQKSLEWFLKSSHRFLFHCEEDGKVVGYCGGFAPAFYGDGSSSGMLQHAFKEAMIGTLKKPWLIFHPELFRYYPHVLKNIKRKIFKTPNSSSSISNTQKEIDPVVGLVIIGIHPSYRGKGVFELLMTEFEKQAADQNRKEVNLSVKKNNFRAINAYKKFGWLVRKEEGDAIKMHKFL